MSRYIARIIRALIVSCIGFGGGVGLMVFIGALVMKGDQHAFQYGLKAGLLLGGIFAVLLVCVMLPLDLTARLFLSKTGYKEIWELEQCRDFEFEGPLKNAIAHCRQALLAVPNIGSVIEDAENLVIRASTGISWRSRGEQIDVEINPIAENKWQLKCTSRPPSSDIVFDYGKNFDNVECWLKEMSSPTNAGKF